MMEDIFVILDIDIAHNNNLSYIVLVMKRLRDKKRMLFYDPNYRQYFYVIPNEQNNIYKLKQEIEHINVAKGDENIKVLDTEIVERTYGLEKIKCVKVYLRKPSHYLELKDKIKELPSYGKKIEKDIPMTKNYLADKGISSGRKVRVKYIVEKNPFKEFKISEIGKIIEIKEENEPVRSDDLIMMAFDIETVQDNGKENIIMFSYSTNTNKQGVIHLGSSVSLQNTISVYSEKELIEKLSQIISEIDPDIIFTYNGDEFDFELLKRKIDMYSLSYSFGFGGKGIEGSGRRSKSYRIFGRVHFDLYKFVSRILAPTLNVEVLSLDAVASEIIGEGKKDMSFERISDLWKENDLREVIEYCLNDSKITLKLGEYLFPTFTSLSDITKLLLYDISRATYGTLVESYGIRRGKKTHVLIPNKPKQEEVAERYYLGEYEGAFVYEPKPGLYEDIVVMDFKSLYPSIIITHNIDPFTLTYDCEDNPNKVPDYDYCFLTSPKGFIPSAMEHIYNKRIKVKELVKKTPKDSKEYMFYKAEDYALKTILNSFYGYLGYINSRWYRRECAQAATSFGRYYIKKIIKEAEANGFKVIYGDTDSVFLLLGNKTVEDALRFMEKINSSLPGIIKLDFQGYYKRGIFVRKKEGKIGAKKRYALIDKDDNITIRGFERVRRDWCKLAKDTQEIVLKYVLKGDINKAKSFVREVIENLKRGKVKKEDLIIYVKLQRSLETYESLAPHIAVAKRLKNKGKEVFSGMIIPYIITSRPGKISDKAEIYYLAEDYDADYYINNQVLPAALRVLESLGITKEELLSGSKQKRLF